ncbi:PREDICTED: olfactory receptor 18-like [Chrysochloris asiatica]|uniref:Olfactory receptor n=1 Tax=Chrysochloris asiatica TaxID=185453 RepID=A0A9B0U801_CHRAS|nr:PREDICTED: olfactory receptor 18-like [Chrysochloris asiatica]
MLRPQITPEYAPKIEADDDICKCPETRGLSLLSQRCHCIVEPNNLTRVSEFLLLGLSADPELQPLLFGMFLSMYTVTVLGNLLIILTISSDPHLHTPMYFFIWFLSFADIGFISTTIPKMLLNIHTHLRIISYVGCLNQLYFLMFFGCMDSLLLTVMAYDRFVAICHPLHYPVIINRYICGLLILVSFFLSVLYSQLHYLIMSLLTFCTKVEIPHFYCDPSQLLNLACTETTTKNILVYCIAAIFGGVPVSGIFFSYTRIISSSLRIPSSGGRYKAFSTCGSHLSVVFLFYGTGIGVYLSSAVSSSLKSGAAASVMYSVVTPMLNPFIYSLRNKDIKRALQRLFSRSA